MLAAQHDARLGWRDYALLGLVCALLSGIALLDGRRLTTHETIHCQNVREMLAGNSWIIPTCGGTPWLERPPLPHWLTAVFVKLSGRDDVEWGYRLGSAVMGLVIVCLVAPLAARWYGRSIGLSSGIILATMREFASYAVGPECDIYLAALLTLAMTLFVRYEFGTPPADRRFFGWRSWSLLGFCFLLGLTNTAKGLFFGMLLILVPTVGYLAGNLDRTVWRRYGWFWGGAAFAGAAAAWPLAAYGLYPDILDLWKSDYVGRLNQGYMREPGWYYLANLPWAIFPWTLAALAGLYELRRGLTQRGSPERFLWCWAVLPVAFLSVPQGKHHHYLLSVLSPWAILAAVGSVRVWQWFGAAPTWLRQPWTAALLAGTAGDVALAVVGSRLGGPAWLVPTLWVAWPVFCFLAWWSLSRPRFESALASLVVLILVVHGLAYVYRTRYLDRYEEDARLVAEARALVPAGMPIYVVNDHHPLNASWFLFYLGDRSRLLHNLTFLKDDRLGTGSIFVLARGKDQEQLTQYGSAELLAQSKQSRYETTPADRWALFRFAYQPELPRIPGPIHVSPMQATGRALGPFLP